MWAVAHRGLVPDRRSERGNPAYRAARLVRAATRVDAAGPRGRVLRPARRRGAGAASRATTCSSPTGAATPTSGSARRRARPSAELFGDAARARRRRQGADVALALRTSCPYSEEENRQLGDEVDAAGGEVLLDQRVRRGGSHHQKLVVLRRPGRPDRDVAFAGGIDLCHSRRDDADHHGDPQAAADVRRVRRPPAVARRAARDARPGGRRARHDVPGALDRPALRSTSDSPIAWLQRPAAPRRHRPPTRCPPQPPDPPPCGPHAVQVLRTYPSIRPRYPFAPRRRADGGPRLRQGAAAGRGGWSTWRTSTCGPPHVARLFAARAAAPTRTCTWSWWCRGTPTSTARFALPPNQVGRVAGARGVPRGRRGPGARVRRGEPRGHAGLRARQGRAWSTTCGPAWAATTSTGAPGRTTASCRCAVLDDDARRARARRPGRARRRRPALRPRPAAGR